MYAEQNILFISSRLKRVGLSFAMRVMQGCIIFFFCWVALMNDTISPCSLSDPWLLKPLDRHLLLTSFHICSCWHFGNWSIAQAAVAVFAVTSSQLSLACSTAGYGVCVWTDCPPCPSPLPVPETCSASNTPSALSACTIKAFSSSELFSPEVPLFLLPVCE